MATNSQREFDGVLRVILKGMVIVLIIEVIVKDELIRSHLNISCNLLIVDINDPRQLVHEPQFVDAFAVLDLVLQLFSLHEV